MLGGQYPQHGRGRLGRNIRVCQLDGGHANRDFDAKCSNACRHMLFGHKILEVDVPVRRRNCGAGTAQLNQLDAERLREMKECERETKAEPE